MTIQSIPAPVIFASVEPMLAPFDEMEAPTLCALVDWVIVGGESGKGHREMPLAWARTLRDTCTFLERAFFFKQTAGKGEIPEDLQIRQFPKPRREG
jgi:protein gp37